MCVYKVGLQYNSSLENHKLLLQSLTSAALATLENDSIKMSKFMFSLTVLNSPCIAL